MKELIKFKKSSLIFSSLEQNNSQADAGGGGTSRTPVCPGEKKLFNLSPNIFGFTIRGIINASFLGPTILIWTVDVWEHSVPLVLISKVMYFQTCVAPT
jgi:hypothetical protein